jgi:hypothetical protein
MKKLITVMLGLALTLGCVSVAFGDSPTQTHKKKGGKKSPATPKKGGAK